MNINQRLKLQLRRKLFNGLLLVSSLSMINVHAQELDEVRWKSEQQVRNLYGDPNSVHGPNGTHATYTLWNYDGFTVAFANNRAFHLFKNDSLKKQQKEKDR